MTRTALAALALLAGVLASGPGCRADNPAAADEDGQVLPVANSVEADDYDLDIAGATVIALDTGSITVFGEGVEVAGTRARITRAGTYLAQGTLADGQIEIDAGAAAKVKLILDGVNITTSDDAPILVRNAAKAVLYLPPDTVNTLTDGAASTRDGAIHCKTRLSIFGPGRLSVTGNVDDGINAEGGIVIEDGVYDVRSQHAGLKSDINVIINGGAFRIDAGTDGIHGEESLAVNGGNVNIVRSGEGIEAATITMGGGTVHILSSDDGVNAASGDGGEMGGGRRPGPGEVGSNPFFMKGGYLYVNADGDGLDINGPIEMTGGTILIDGPTRNDNGAIDYTGSFEISGGFFVGAGSAGMAQAPSSSSTQYSVAIAFSSAQAAGTFIQIRDDEGDDVVTFRPAKSYQVVVVSSPRLERGSYSVYVGGYSTGVETDGLFTGGAYVGGVQKATFSVSDVLTVVRAY